MLFVIQKGGQGMLSKWCPRCSKHSFSASLCKWICPYCGHDLINQPAGPAEIRRDDDGEKQPTEVDPES